MSVKIMDGGLLEVYGRSGTPQSFRRLAAGAAALIVLLALLDLGLMFLPGTGFDPGTLGAVDWLEAFQANRLLGLRNLGFLNMLTISLTIPVFLALYALQRQKDGLYLTLALLLVCIGAAIYIANNVSLPMMALSDRYAAAPVEQRPELIVAAQALLAREDLTAGAFPGFLFPELAGMLMGVAMLRGGVFGRRTAWAGILGEGLLLALNVCAAFLPAVYTVVVMPLSVIAGPLVLVWFVLVASRLWRDGSL